jgi:hypothetical protein
MYCRHILAMAAIRLSAAKRAEKQIRESEKQAPSGSIIGWAVSRDFRGPWTRERNAIVGREVGIVRAPRTGPDHLAVVAHLSLASHFVALTFELFHAF